MPAPPRHSPAGRGDAIAHLDAVCRHVVAGKLAARELAAWVRELGASETEFRLLWQLARDATETALPESPPDQAMLADRLAVSPAQVSGVVERLSAKQLIEPQHFSTDRRRQAWRLSSAGRQLVGAVVAHVTQLAMPAGAEQEAA
jgi:DNA-binding MarR family transcriptional regulator